MSKRAERKEHLARLLDAGKIDQATYDFQMARMKKKGQGAKARQQASNREKFQAKLGPEFGRQEWSPQAAAAETTFQSYLNSEKERLDLTQPALAAILGQSTRTICYWLSGERIPDNLTQIGVRQILSQQETPKTEPNK